MIHLESQVASFLDYHRRRGGLWELAFVAWSTSKDFRPADARAIRRAVEQELGVTEPELATTERG